MACSMCRYASGGEDGIVRVHVFDSDYADFDQRIYPDVAVTSERFIPAAAAATATAAAHTPGAQENTEDGEHDGHGASRVAS